MLDIRQSLQYANYLERTGWEVEKIAGINYFFKKLPLIGSFIKIQRPERVDYKTINDLTKKHRAFQIVVEPKTETDGKKLTANGFRPSNSPFLPTKTLYLDLTKTTETLLVVMKKDARSAISRKARLQTANYAGNIKEFRNAWRKTIGWQRYVPPLSQLTALKESFGNNCLFLMEKMGNAGGIFLINGKTAYYWQAFTNSVGRKTQTQYKIVWEGMLWAKKKGAKVFDFEGIYDERFPNKSWLGFTHFKKSFGGYEVTYPGAFVLNRLPF